MTIIKTTKVCYFLVLAALLSPLTTQAAFITLTPTTAVLDVNDGDTIVFDITMDFTSEPTIGGGFDIAFDATALQLQSYNRFDVGDPILGRDPDNLAGLLSGWAFYAFNGVSGPALIGNVTFQVLTSMGVGTSVSTQANASGITGSFISATNFIDILDVTFNSIDITRATNQQPQPQPQPMPEPATIMLLSLGMVLVMRKGKR